MAKKIAVKFETGATQTVEARVTPWGAVALVLPPGVRRRGKLVLPRRYFSDAFLAGLPNGESV